MRARGKENEGTQPGAIRLHTLAVEVPHLIHVKQVALRAVAYSKAKVGESLIVRLPAPMGARPPRGRVPWSEPSASPCAWVPENVDIAWKSTEERRALPQPCVRCRERDIPTPGPQRSNL